MGVLNGKPEIELDQLERQPLEICCKMSSIISGIIND